LLAGASCALVRLPLFAGLVNASGTWLSASARLLGASDYAGVASACLAATGVTLLFECSSNVVGSSHVCADNLFDTAGLVAGHLSILITSAITAIWVIECASRPGGSWISVAIVCATAGFVLARNLAI